MFVGQQSSEIMAPVPKGRTRRGASITNKGRDPAHFPQLLEFGFQSGRIVTRNTQRD